MYGASCKKGKNKWSDIGSALKLDQSDLTAIEDYRRGNYDRCYNDMLAKWFESSTNCYFDVFTDALSKVGLSPMIPELKEAIYKHAGKLKKSTSGQKG